MSIGIRTGPGPSTVMVAGPGRPAHAAARRPSTLRRSLRRTSPLRRIVSLVAAALTIGALWPAQFGGITSLTVVRGQSMEPVYRSGDLVITVRLPDYAIGDIVSYTVPEGQPGAGGRVIHRIIGEDAAGTARGADGAALPYLSQGDNNPDIDPWRFAANDVMGVAVLSVPVVGGLIGSLGDPVVIGLGAGLLVTIILWPKNAPAARPRRFEEAESP